MPSAETEQIVPVSHFKCSDGTDCACCVSQLHASVQTEQTVPVSPLKCTDSNTLCTSSAQTKQTASTHPAKPIILQASS